MLIMKWTEELDNELKKLVNKHKNYIEISKEMNLSIRSLQNRGFRLGLKIDLLIETNCTRCEKKIRRCRSQINNNKNFCSSSCAASYNNKGRVHSSETKEKIRKKLKNINKKEDKIRIKVIKIKKCHNCYNLISNRRKICDKCKMIYYDYYRQSCKFKFNVYSYPNEFNLKLIEKYGWYKAKNKGDNPSGVNRDHIYSIKDGFNNKINPIIISHPANCQIITHKDNIIKNAKSNITIIELTKKINLWNLMYDNIK